MIIKKLQMCNIRSYTIHHPIVFSRGTILFQGDVGSGKSTILLAIEFALFGLGDIEGQHLLRGKENEGWVQLEFEVNGQDYTVYRSLVRKRKYIRQGEGYIIEGNTRTDYAVTEMKERMLHILDFKERPRPKTSSLIFRYAVFTPQEMMKEVLFQRVDRRLDTLRRAFGIEDYSIARTNIEVLRGRLRDNINYIRGQTQDLEEKTASVHTEEGSLTTLNTDLDTLTKQFTAIDKDLTTVKTRIITLTQKKEYVLKLETNITHLQQNIQTESRNLKLLAEDLAGLGTEKQNAETAKVTLEKLKPQYDEFQSISKHVQQLDTVEQQYQQVKARIHILITSISKAKEQLQLTIDTAVNEIQRRQAEIDKTKPKLQKISTLKKDAREIQARIDTLPSLSTKLTTLKHQRSRCETQIEGFQTELDSKQDEWDNIETIGVGAHCPRCRQTLTTEHFKQVKGAYTGELTQLRSEIKAIEQDIPELHKKIASLENTVTTLEKERMYLDELRPTIATLEQQKRSNQQQENEIAQTTKELELDRVKLANENYALQERTSLTQAQTQLQTLEPQKNQLDSLKQQLRAYQEAGVERQYIENTQIAGLYPTIMQKIDTITNRHQTLDQHIRESNEQLVAMKQQFNDEKGVLEQLRQLEIQKENLENKWKASSNSISGKNVAIQAQKKTIHDLKEAIAKKKELLSQHDVYQHYLRWIDEKFNPATEDIERHVMASIRDDFNELFQRWFSQLMEMGDITVRIDDHFTPLIEQNGYELAVNSLSGGEKTSVALAYRLALNIMVKRVCEAMHSNLLMLDEPTDGFSTEQLVRVRDILDDLQCEQVIMVSHERELEGFVDKIFKVRKETGISQVIEL